METEKKREREREKGDRENGRMRAMSVKRATRPVAKLIPQKSQMYLLNYCVGEYYVREKFVAPRKGKKEITLFSCRV
jgi:hypothetical protein